MNVIPKSLLLLLFILLVSASNLAATEDYATATDRDCGVCHVAVAGGGELTPAGASYARFLEGSTPAAGTQPALLSHTFRLLVGFFHILFAFFWFGTILYVHLILKPAYASQGLPRGEVRLGLLSMGVMGVTGAILYAYRVPSFASLLDSRFGLLLLLKIVLYLIMVGTAMLAVFFLAPRMRQKRQVASAATAGDLTLNELAQCDGQDGRPAYFAFRGEIFDASNSARWKNGAHMGRHHAGVDLTAQLDQAPHGADLVLALPKVGQLRSAEAPGLSPPQKVFYAIAYLNLGFVLAIILILACWKWL